MNVLVIGFGSMGKRHAENLRRFDHDVYVYDPFLSPEKRIECMNRPGHRIVENIDDGLKVASHVIVATPAWHHAEHVLLAIKAGKDVFVEKPIVQDVATGAKLLAEAKKRNITIAVGYNWRAHREVITLRRRIRLSSGWSQIVFSYTGDRSTWPGTYDDILLECSHHIDLAHYLFDEPIEPVYAKVRKDDYFIAGYIGKRRVTFMANWAIPGAPSEHTILVKGSHICEAVTYNGKNEDHQYDLKQSYKDELGVWIDHKAPFCNGGEALTVLKDIETIRRVNAG